MTHLWVGALIWLCMMALPAPTAAQDTSFDPYEENAAPAEPDRDDAVRDPGIGMTVLGGVAMAGGVALLTSAKDKEVCGVTGCFEVTRDIGQKQGGASLIGAGAGVLLVGLPLLVAGELTKPPPHGYRSASRMATGAVLGAMGVGGIGSGIAYLAIGSTLPPTNDQHGLVGGVMLGLGAAHLAVGAPLFFTGAQPGDAASAAQADREAQAPRRSEGMMYSGIALMVGGVVVGASSMVWLTTPTEVSTALVIATAVPGAAMVVTGIPLAAYGGSRVSLSLDPSSMQLGGRF